MHNTRGLGLANCLAAYDVGVRTFDASLGGLGGCPFAPGASGNICTEDMVNMLEDMAHDTRVDLAKLLAVSRRIRHSTKVLATSVTSARSARSGEIQIIIAIMATTVSSEVSSWLRVCCRLWATLSMSLVTRLSRSPRVWPSTYANGSRCSFASTVRRRRSIDRWIAPVRRYDCP